VNTTESSRRGRIHNNNLKNETKRIQRIPNKYDNADEEMDTNNIQHNNIKCTHRSDQPGCDATV